MDVCQTMGADAADVSLLLLLLRLVLVLLAIIGVHLRL